MLVDAQPDNEACSNITNNVTGMVVVIDRGNCTFESKVEEAEQDGAVGVIIVNNVPGNPIVMGDAGLGTNLPVLHVSEADGALIRADMQAGSPDATLVRTDVQDRDSGLDNKIPAASATNKDRLKASNSCVLNGRETSSATAAGSTTTAVQSVCGTPATAPLTYSPSEG